MLQRGATAAIARRQQWQTIPITDCPRTLAAATQEPCEEVGADRVHAGGLLIQHAEPAWSASFHANQDGQHLAHRADMPYPSPIAISEVTMQLLPPAA